MLLICLSIEYIAKYIQSKILYKIIEQVVISTQMQKQMVDQAVDLWLVEETSRYMFRLLAAKAVAARY